MMALDIALVDFQRFLNSAWQRGQGDNALSQNEFDYLACIYQAQFAPVDASEGHNDSTHLSVLANQLGVRKSSASLMVNKLQKRGFLTRVTCRFDARAQHIVLTEQGQSVYLEVKQQVYGALAQQIQASLGNRQAQTLADILATLTRAN